MKIDRFISPGSPLDGRVVPPDWKSLDATGKRARCVALGWARNFYEAGVLLAKHASASVSRRKRREERTRRIRSTCWWLAD